MPRVKAPLDLRLLCKVSRLYYEQDVREEEIASRLLLSRSKVSRLLNQARETGVVKISVVSPPGIYPHLEQKLEDLYHLQDAIVVDVTDAHTRDVETRALGTEAAHYLQATLREGDKIGISWGTTLNAMVTALQPQRSMNNHIVQVIGGLGPPTSEVHATDLCRRMGAALHCPVTLLPAPGIVETAMAKDIMLSDRYIQMAFDLFDRLDVLYVGVGAPTPTSVVMRDGSIMNHSELKDLRNKGIVGDIALRYFDAQGNPVHSDLDERVIGITLEQIKKVRRVVGISGGEDKIPAIHGALSGRYLDVLITDHKTAELLVK